MTENANLIAGRNPVREALENPDVTVEKILVQQGLRGRVIEEILRTASAGGVPVQHVPPARLGRMAPGLAHQGVVAVTAPVVYEVFEDLLWRIAPGPDEVRARKPVLVLLDQIEDPHNYGAILRSALAAGAAGVVVPTHHMAPLSAATVKSSAGTALRIPIARVTNLADAIDQLKERGYWVVGAAGDGDTSLWAMDWDRPLAIVIGSEGSGLRSRVRGQCDYLVSIPLRGPVESLNASVAAGILLFAAVRARPAL